MRIIAAIFTAIAITASAQTANEGAHIVWLQSEHDFGTIKEEAGIATCKFFGVNTGTEPIAVISASANCGCTTPRYPTAPVYPGDTLQITVSYNPQGRPGRFEKKAFITTNAEEGKTTLRIRGTAIGSACTLQSRFPIESRQARLSRNIIPMGETRKGRPLAGGINIYNTTSQPITPMATGLPAYMHSTVKPHSIQPGEQGSLMLTCYTDSCDDWGFVTDEIFLIPDINAENPDTVTVTTTMIINEDFSKLTQEQREKAPCAKISDENIDFGSFTIADKPIKRSFTITNEGKSDLIIRRIYSQEKSLRIDNAATSIKPGKSADIHVTFTPALLSGTESLLNSRITVITNSPTTSTQTIRAIGEKRNR